MGFGVQGLGKAIADQVLNAETQALELGQVQRFRVRFSRLGAGGASNSGDAMH